MDRFTFNAVRSLHFGTGCLADLGSLVRGHIGSRVLLVTDPGMVETGIVGRACATLAASGVEISVFQDVQADPPESVIQHAAVAARDMRANGIVGLGGGSSLDVAKLVAVLALGEEQLADIYGIGNIKGSRLPLVLVPTTAGTGSEVTPISIVTTGTDMKMGVISPVILPDIALLDPELTLDLPPHITAATGIDAMVHAIEAYASKNANNNPLSKTLATQALILIGRSIREAVENGRNIAARSEMLLGSMLAGQAFANSPVAAVHALAYPIGSLFHVAHGLSNALVLPHVLRFNAEIAPEPYAEIAPLIFPDLIAFEGLERAHAFCDRLADLSKACSLPQRLRDVSIDTTDLPRLASEAMRQTRLLENNPRQVTEADALSIYTASY